MLSSSKANLISKSSILHELKESTMWRMRLCESEKHTLSDRCYVALLMGFMVCIVIFAVFTHAIATSPYYPIDKLLQQFAHDIYQQGTDDMAYFNTPAPELKSYQNWLRAAVVLSAATAGNICIVIVLGCGQHRRLLLPAYAFLTCFLLILTVNLIIITAMVHGEQLKTELEEMLQRAYAWDHIAFADIEKKLQCCSVRENPLKTFPVKKSAPKRPPCKSQPLMNCNFVAENSMLGKFSSFLLTVFAILFLALYTRAMAHCCWSIANRAGAEAEKEAEARSMTEMEIINKSKGPVHNYEEDRTNTKESCDKDRNDTNVHAINELATNSDTEKQLDSGIDSMFDDGDDDPLCLQSKQ